MSHRGSKLSITLGAKAILPGLVETIERIRIEMIRSVDYQPSRVVSMWYLLDEVGPLYPQFAEADLRRFITYALNNHLDDVVRYNEKGSAQAFIVNIPAGVYA